MSNPTLAATATVAVRERPIIMTGESVRGILSGAKVQTRRVVKLRRGVTFTNCTVSTWDAEAARLRAVVPEEPDIAPYLLGARRGGQCLVCNLIDDVGIDRVDCPYGQPGDRLWVRETWHCPRQLGGSFQREKLVFRADETLPWRDYSAVVWKSPIHMPRAFSRLALEITDVRVERVQSISYADVLAEGCPVESLGASPADHEWYRALWDSLNAKRGYGWDADPYVWALTFRRVQP